MIKDEVQFQKVRIKWKYPQGPIYYSPEEINERFQVWAKSDPEDVYRRLDLWDIYCDARDGVIPGVSKRRRSGLTLLTNNRSIE